MSEQHEGAPAKATSPAPDNEKKKHGHKSKSKTTSPASALIDPAGAQSPSSSPAAAASSATTTIVRLNVGGVTFETTPATLSRGGDNSPKSSFFVDLLAGRASSAAVTKDERTGAYFIDRDPVLFGPILEYLRTGRFHASPTILGALYNEAQFYGVHLPTGKIFEKESEYHTEVVSLPKTAKTEGVQALINDRETLGFTFLQCVPVKSEILLFFKK